MLDLFLTVLCTSANALIIKLAETRISNRLAMLFATNIVAGATGIIVSLMCEPAGIAKLSIFPCTMGIFGGAIFRFQLFRLLPCN